MDKDARNGPESTRLEAILSGMDIEVIQAMESDSWRRNAGGGTVSFLFEKCSNIDLEEVTEHVEE